MKGSFSSLESYRRNSSFNGLIFLVRVLLSLGRISVLKIRKDNKGRLGSSIPRAFFTSFFCILHNSAMAASIFLNPLSGYFASSLGRILVLIRKEDNGSLGLSTPRAFLFFSRYSTKANLFSFNLASYVLTKGSASSERPCHNSKIAVSMVLYFLSGYF